MQASFEESYRQFFKALTGTFPYEYQEELAQWLAASKSIVLRAPTGSGKTWAALAPFLFQRTEGQRNVDRLIYALPLRSLASSLHKGTIDALKGLPVTFLDSARNRHYSSDDPLYVTLQMGGQQDDPFFEGDVIFTTIDQLLSSYLFAPLSLPDRVGNIGAGAMVGSLLVFDEVHLLDPTRSLATTIEMLDRLKGLARFVLMSATLPDAILDWLAQKFGAIKKTLSSGEVQALPSHAAKERSVVWVSRLLTADDIVDNHKERTIAIVNSVSRAQSLFREVRRRLEAKSAATELVLLHARFYPEHRQRWESQLEGYFGHQASKSDAILISTQVVEAGIDISADILLTELAPLNSLLQRAGRVARYRDRNTGTVLVFELQADNQGKPNLGPYRDQREAVDATRRVLQNPSAAVALDYFKELEWLNEVHGASDLVALLPLNSLHSHRGYVSRAMDGLDVSARSRLIRDTASIAVILTANPEAVSFEARRWPQLLSVPRTSLFRLREAGSIAQGHEWVLKIPLPDETESSPSGGLHLTWATCTDPAQAAWLVAIHPAYASYLPDVGLELARAPATVPALTYPKSTPLPRYSYERETFVAHARRVVNQAQRLVAYHSEMVRMLGERYPGRPILDLINLVCAMHDVGKLQVAWQAEANRWQQQQDSTAGVNREASVPLAHTTYDPDRDKGNSSLPDFPPHATCGAFALLDYFGNHFPDEARALCTAIARHHGPHTSRLDKYELIPGTATVLQECLPDGLPQPLSVYPKAERHETERFSCDCLLHFSEDGPWWPLYVGLVRILRLADQGSFQEQS